MHNNKIVHRDLKPENILLEHKGDINDLKLIDFGTCRRYNNDVVDGVVKIYDKKGTIMYIAPEVLNASNSKTGAGKYYDEKCDIWSIGVIAYALVCGK